MRRISLLYAAALALVISTACGLDKTSVPDGFTGPSEFGISLTMTASPELLARDGASQSTVAITARDSAGNTIANRGIRIFASTGRLSANEVTTGSNGVATVQYTAPGINDDVTVATISAAPTGNDIANFVPRRLDIALLGPSIPVAAFTWTPQSPAQFALTTFDGSGTTVGGRPCGSACTYEWNFGGEATATGIFETHRFQEQGTYRVTLTVTTSDGASASASNNVTVAAGVAPSGRIRFSPASPCVGQTVFFNASESSAANGAEVEEYEWDFGNGTFGASSPNSTTSVTYSAAGSYTVLLTVTDSNGLRTTATTTVTVRGLTGTPPSCS
jgi:PKD repeat protein